MQESRSGVIKWGLRGLTHTNSISSSSTILGGGRHLTAGNEGGTADPSDPLYAFYIFMVFLCLILAALASGLTQGLLSLDITELHIKSESGTLNEKKYSKAILPIRSQHHLILVTFMLWNAMANEALPIFLGKLVNEYVAIAISVTCVLFVGEIIPAAILTGPSQMRYAYYLSSICWAAIYTVYPISYPIVKLLDYLLGHDNGITLYNKKELTTMLNMQHNAGKAAKNHEGVHHDEVTIIGNALKFRKMRVDEAMTPLREAHMMSSNKKLNYATISEIFKNGYSRIPVYRGDDVHEVLGVILTKDLIAIDPEDETPVMNFVELFGRRPIEVWVDDKLGDVLNKFKSMRAHMAIVRDVMQNGEYDPVYQSVGIITMEDIIEQILGDEIEDETDETCVLVNESTKKANISNRDIYFARLRLLNPRLQPGEGLNDIEVKAIVAHLVTNVDVFKEAFGRRKAALQRFLKKNAKIVNLKGVETPSEAEMLYRRGKVSNACSLILNGKVTVLAGKDGFSSEVGTWNVIGADALVMAEGRFVPDFSCYPCSDNVRLLRINISAEAVAQHLKSDVEGEEEEENGNEGGGDSGGRKKKKDKAKKIKNKIKGVKSPRRSKDSSGGDEDSYLLDNNSL